MTITITEPGRAERTFELSTNDPRMPAVKVSVAVNVKPLPDSVKRIENSVLSTGEEVGGFNIWPVAQPRVSVERKDGLTMSLRIRKKNPVAGTIELQEGTSE